MSGAVVTAKQLRSKWETINEKANEKANEYMQQSTLNDEIVGPFRHSKILHFLKDKINLNFKKNNFLKTKKRDGSDNW